MTCVVGWTDGETVTLASDSAASGDGEIRALQLPKVFVRGDYVFGFCGSYRIGQILHYCTELPPAPAGGPLEPFLVRKLVPALRRAVASEGAAGEGRAFLGEKTGLLIGCQGQIWCVGHDLTVVPEAPYAAIGSGRSRAYGALFALASETIPVQRRLELALAAAAEFTPGVRPPWHFVQLPAASTDLKHGRGVLTMARRENSMVRDS